MSDNTLRKTSVTIRLITWSQRAKAVGHKALKEIPEMLGSGSLSLAAAVGAFIEQVKITFYQECRVSLGNYPIIEAR